MCRIDHDPTLPVRWLRHLWRTIVIGGILWLLIAPEARAARFSPGAVPGDVVEAAERADTPAARVPGFIKQVHAPSAR